ncbi:MAG: DUF3127 domain-containing protein [Bacteroidales bacterium]|nr:DUF3127 domain-containing protein [Candidatus Colicola equi]
MEQQYTASGKITHVLPLQEGVSKAGKAWCSQSFVIEVPDDKYPTNLCFELYGSERIQKNPVKEGDEVTVSFDPESREWNGRWFTSLRAWKVEKLGAAQPTTDPRPTPESTTVAASPQMPTIPQVPQDPTLLTFDQMQAEAAEDFGDGNDLPF